MSYLVGVHDGPMTGWRIHYIGDGLYQVILFHNGMPIECATRSDAQGAGPWKKEAAEHVLNELLEQLAHGVRLEAL